MKNKNNKIQYWSPSITTDIVIFTIEDNVLKVLLIKRAANPFKSSWALPGGFLHKGENTRQAALRILKDKAGVKNVYIEQLYTFDANDRDPRGPIISVAYFTLVPRSKIKFSSGKNTQTPEFFSVKKLPRLAFDHKKIIAYAHKRLEAKLEYTTMVFSFLPSYFTFGQLQKTYEIILGKKLDKRNFRKKFLLLELIKLTSKMLTGSKQRPARLYKLITSRSTELKKFF